MRNLESSSLLLIEIKALGGQPVRAPDGELWAIFDREAQPVTFDDSTTVASGPQLVARTIDVRARNVARGQVIDVEGESFRVSHLINDGTGMTTIILEAP